MTLRALIVIVLFAFGILPVACTVALNFPRALRALEQANLELLEGALRRDLKLVAMQLGWREENLRQLHGHPGTRELAAGVPVQVPIATLLPRMEQMYRQMYAATTDVHMFRLFDAAGRGQFTLVWHEDGPRSEVPVAPGEQFRAALTALPATGEVRLIGIEPCRAEPSAIHAILAARLSPPKPGSEGGFIALDVNLAALFDQGSGYLLLRGDGVMLNGPAPWTSALTDFPGLKDVLGGHRGTSISHRDDRRSFIMRPLLLADSDETSLWIAGEVDRSAIEALRSGTLLRLLGVTTLLVLLVLLLADRLAGRLEQHRNALMGFLARLLADEAPEKLPWRRPRELRLLGEELQRLADGHRRMEEERAAIQEQLIQSQKLESLGGLAAGIAHDFNNILSVISGHGQMALIRQESGQRAVEELTAIQQAVKRASRLTRRLLLLGRREPPRMQPLDLRELIGGTKEMVGGLLGKDIRLRLEPADEPLDVVADGSMLEQVLLNLIINARDAMPAGGEIVIRGGRRRHARHERRATTDDSRPSLESFIFLTVRDSGEGMDEATRRRIFEPCFTTKPRGKGSGLGLAVVQSIVTIHRGWVEVESSPGGGSTFSVYLPARTISG